MIAAVYDWSGFYVGLNAGGASSHDCWDNVNIVVVREGCHNATGALAGGQMGFRWQSGAWVFGVEGQGDWASLKGSNASIPVAFFAGAPLLTNQTKVNALGLLTGQVGYAWDSVLFYVKGGAAVTDERYNGLITGTNAQIDTGTRNPLGRRGRRRHRIRFCAELVGRARIRPPVHGQSQYPVLLRRGWLRRGRPHRSHHPGRRHGHGPCELPLGRSGDRKILSRNIAI